MSTMLRKLRRHVTYANVLSTICFMVIVGTSTAWAAQHLRGADIVDNSLTGKDIKNGSLTATDLAPATRTTYADTSPWEKIPSGKTVTGSFYESYIVRGINDIHVVNLQLPALPSATFDMHDVNFAPDAYSETVDDDPSCTGTYLAPTAPAGKICVYLEGGAGITNAQAVGWAQPQDRARGQFYVQWYDNVAAGAGATLWGNWAYTAP